MVIRWPQGREHGANVVAERLRRENLPIPAHHGGQSKHGEREPNEPANQMRARLRQGLGALRLAFVVVSHVRSSKSRLRHCKPGRKKRHPKLAAELPPTGLSGSRKTSSARKIDETHLSASRRRSKARVHHDSAATKKLWAPAAPGPNSVPPPRSLPG